LPPSPSPSVFGSSFAPLLALTPSPIASRPHRARRPPGPQARYRPRRPLPRRPLSPIDTFQTRLTFSPSREGQQAGILFWQQPLHYLSLSRRFTTRNTLSLTLHTPNTPPQFLDFPDPGGQFGLPLWLLLERRTATITAATSLDGHHWQPLGSPFTFPLGPSSRGGIFAFNGRRDHPSQVARFDMTSQSVADESF